jgi:sRNA-binding carbon storage regulator CsrA
MLVISRQIHERIKVTHAPTGQTMEIIIVRIDNNVVRIGLEGNPEEFAFMRDDAGKASK